MEIKVGDYDVFKDGTIISTINQNVDFVFVEEVDFVIRVVFINDVTNQEPSIKAEAFGKGGAKLVFKNFNNSIGIGSVEPLVIGTLNGRPLYLNYIIYALSMGGKSFQYTWLLGKEVKNG